MALYQVKIKPQFMQTYNVGNFLQGDIVLDYQFSDPKSSVRGHLDWS